MIEREFERMQSRRRRNDMKRICASLALVAGIALGHAVSLTPAHAAPPTVTPSPGYDARLQEQRARRTTYEPFPHPARPPSRRHARRIHGGAH
jgi:predicted aconitase